MRRGVSVDELDACTDPLIASDPVLVLVVAAYHADAIDNEKIERTIVRTKREFILQNE
jgi:hypothetical protein